MLAPSPAPLESPPESRDDPQRLLATYLDSGCAEEPFARLVAHTGGLVYASALRRTGNPQMAEEVAQNVFTLLARKAPSLRNHPSLAGWIFQTTRYEAAKAMRAETRRQRKLEAFMAESATGTSATENAPWQDALPALHESLDRLTDHERDLVLARFFEGRRFAEIAERSGRSEAACKMGLRRTLTKLSGLLGARGVTLSGAALASALTAEFAHGAPVHVLAALAPNALAGSGALTAGALLTNTIQTMSTIKTVTLTAAAVAVIASGPILWQESKASRLRGELAALDSRLASGEFGPRAGEGASSGAAQADTGADTIRHLLSAADEPVDVDRLMADLIEAMTSRDTLAMIRVFLPLANLGPEDYSQLVAEIQNHRSAAEIKQVALQIVAGLAPSEHPRDSLERLMALAVQPHAYSNLLSLWASEDPAAAYAWFLAKRESGALAGKGVQNTVELSLLGQLVGGAASHDPDLALDIFEAHPEPDARMHMVMTLGQAVGKHVKRTGDSAPLERLLDLAGADQRFQIVESASHSVAEGAEFDAGLAFIGQYLEDSAQRRAAVVNMLNNQREVPVDERGDWLVANLSAEDLPAAVGDFAQRMGWEGQPEIGTWLGTLAPGPVRDRGLQGLSAAQAGASSFEASLATAQRIADAGTRAVALDELRDSWVKVDPEAARRALPAEATEQTAASATD
ncbi:hypothetical protein BH23VER1_BH23VER1_21870 [soil metagenome]